MKMNNDLRAAQGVITGTALALLFWAILAATLLTIKAAWGCCERVDQQVKSFYELAPPIVACHPLDGEDFVRCVMSREVTK